MDRPIRPLFPAGFFDEVQIQANVLASDRQNDPDVLAMNGASAALAISPLPFQGPLGSVRLAQVNGEFIPFPTIDQLEESDLDLVVSGSKSAILMIEGFAREMPEDRMLEALDECHRIIRILCEMQDELVAKAGFDLQIDAPELLTAGQTAEKAAQYAARNADLEARVRVLERIVTDDPTSLVGLPLIALTRMLRQRAHQEYFEALEVPATSPILRRFVDTHGDMRNLPAKVAIQMNDTHPSIRKVYA